MSDFEASSPLSELSDEGLRSVPQTPGQAQTPRTSPYRTAQVASGSVAVDGDRLPSGAPSYAADDHPPSASVKKEDARDSDAHATSIPPNQRGKWKGYAITTEPVQDAFESVIVEGRRTRKRVDYRSTANGTSKVPGNAMQSESSDKQIRQGSSARSSKSQEPDAAVKPNKKRPTQEKGRGKQAHQSSPTQPSVKVEPEKEGLPTQRLPTIKLKRSLKLKAQHQRKMQQDKTTAAAAAANLAATEQGANAADASVAAATDETDSGDDGEAVQPVRKRSKGVEQSVGRADQTISRGKQASLRGKGRAKRGKGHHRGRVLSLREKKQKKTEQRDKADEPEQDEGEEDEEEKGEKGEEEDSNTLFDPDLDDDSDEGPNRIPPAKRQREAEMLAASPASVARDAAKKVSSSSSSVKDLSAVIPRASSGGDAAASSHMIRPGKAPGASTPSARPTPAPAKIVRKSMGSSVLANLMGYGGSASASSSRDGTPNRTNVRPASGGIATGSPSVGGTSKTGRPSATPKVAGEGVVGASMALKARPSAPEDPGLTGKHVTAEQMAAMRVAELEANANPRDLFDLLHGAELMMEFEDETRQRLSSDALVHSLKLYRPGRTEGMWSLVDRIKRDRQDSSA